MDQPTGRKLHFFMPRCVICPIIDNEPESQFTHRFSSTVATLDTGRFSAIQKHPEIEENEHRKNDRNFRIVREEL